MSQYYFVKIGEILFLFLKKNTATVSTTRRIKSNAWFLLADKLMQEEKL